MSSTSQSNAPTLKRQNSGGIEEMDWLLNGTTRSLDWMDEFIDDNNNNNDAIIDFNNTKQYHNISFLHRPNHLNTN